jgi:phage-related protein
VAEVASAYVSLLPSAKGFGRKMDSQIGGAVAASGKKSGAVWGKVFGAVAGLAIGAKAIGFVGDSLAEAREAQKVGAQTEAVLKSTAKAAGINAEQIGKMATRLSNFTGIDDEAIQSGENLLLTFTNIRNEVGGQFTGTFDAATGVMVDMSAALGQDMKSSAVQLGKALNDPIKGITALSRVGVSFTEQQKEQIKTLVESGKTTQAQSLILAELTKEFGGSAAAQATASDKARVAVGNLKEQIGTALLPVVDKLANFVTQKAVPAVSNFITGMQDGTGAGGQFAEAARKVWGRLQDVYNALVPVVKWMIDNKTAVGTFIGVLAGFSILRSITNGFIALNAAMAANPVGLVVVAIAALAAGLVYAYKKSETFRNIVDGAFEAVGNAGRSLWNDFLAPVFRFIVNGIGDVIEGVADMLGALSHVPGFGWAETAANKMHAAADAAHGLADSINDIPNRTVSVNVMVNTSAIAKAEAQLDRFTQHASNQFPHSPVKEGPLRAFNKYGGIGGALMNSLTEGIKAGSPRAEEALKNHIDRLKTRLTSLKDTAKSLAEQVASAFTVDAFSVSGTDAVFAEDGTLLTPATTALQNFMATLSGNVNNLKAVQAALTKIKSLGASDSFIKTLFSSGNSALVFQLAAGGTDAVSQAQDLFGAQQSLGAQLGSDVAQTVLGDEIRGVRDEIRGLRKDLKTSGRENAQAFAAVLNGVATNAIKHKGGKVVLT